MDKLPNVDIEQISETGFILSKGKEPEIKVGNYYVLELADYIIHPNSNFTLAANWNRGIVPNHKYVKAMVTQMLGKMIKTDSIGLNDILNDTDESYLGLWLPMGGVKIIKQL